MFRTVGVVAAVVLLAAPIPAVAVTSARQGLVVTAGEVLPVAAIVRAQPGDWHVLADAAHRPANVTGVECLTSGGNAGMLAVTFTAVGFVGGVVGTGDESVWGGYTLGASVQGYPNAINPALFQIRNPSGGAVSCASSFFDTNAGNFWLVGHMWPVEQ